jgi:aerobic-type carbon monoxide dehydrogenase small subunit (CoxS/CutS family)
MSDNADLKIPGDTSRAVSRRRFIKGVIAGGAAVSSAGYLFRSSAVHGAGGVGERLITLNVNGQRRRVDVMKQETLAWTLRYKLGLTGTKLGCDRAECGACTVLLGDVPQCAFCMSGFVMAAAGFLKTKPNPTRLELAHGVSGNLCRCQDYDKILTALMRGAENLRKVDHV